MQGRCRPFYLEGCTDFALGRRAAMKRQYVFIESYLDKQSYSNGAIAGRACDQHTVEIGESDMKANGCHRARRRNHATLFGQFGFSIDSHSSPFVRYLGPAIPSSKFGERMPRTPLKRRLRHPTQAPSRWHPDRDHYSTTD